VKKRRNLIILLAMAALVAVSLYFIIPPGEKTRLGLDLQGGLEVVYTAKTADGKAPTAQQMDQAIGILDRRVNGLGVTESQIQKQGSDQISVALPGVADPQQALDIIGKTAQLQFFKDDAESRPVSPVDTKEAALKELRELGVSKAEIDQLRVESNTEDHALVEIPPGTRGNETTQWAVFRLPPAMTGEAISDASAGFSQTGAPQVNMDFTGEGSDTFQEITKELFRVGSLKRTPQTFAIVLDNVMESDPMIDYTDAGLADGISGGAVISGGNMTVQEAKDLAFVLRTGALPLKLVPAYQQQVSATLGQDSLDQALFAGLVGLGLVLIYMLAYYRFLGLVADLALIVYGVMLWGVFNLSIGGFWPGVTLTLPGIAGMILTIGVACDANIVIFERIKEEVRRGRTVRSAVNSGYALGFKTILDANVLTILTALVLFIFATAQPKGFALTLIIGVVVSMITAVAFTRAMLGVLAGFAFFNKPAFMGVRSSEIEQPPAQGARAARRARPTTEPAAETGTGAPASAASDGGRRRSTTSRKKRKRR
jgi:preprotein translocase subunit SecD